MRQQSARCKVQRERITKTFVLCSVLFALCSLPCFAAEKTFIQSDSLEYEEKTSTYAAEGKVRIERGAARIEAEKILYNEKSSEAVAEGNVFYEDEIVRIRAKKAALKLEAKTGTLYDAEVFAKKDNYHITGLEIEKTGEREYRLKDASFTTCDAPVPAWCFRGKEVDLVVGDRLKARNITFNIKGQPVAYSPYFSAALSNERKTGLLMPAVGYVEGKGIHYEQDLFIVLSDNRDATLVLDGYSDRGIGGGIEYRFLGTDGAKGNLWVYHLKDTTLKRNFWDVRGTYEDREGEKKVDGFLSLNYINAREFYSEYYPYLVTKMRGYVDSASYLNLTTSRFFESNGEASMRFDKSRLFLRGQYLVDLKEGAEASTVPQRLPEIGYAVNPVKIGPLTFSLDSSISNFHREKEAFGRRLDIFPKVSYSFGSDVTILQSLGLRETAYSLSRSGEFGSSPHRESLEYAVAAQTRLVKQYASFLHILEPSLGFTYVPPAGSGLPIFDSAELFSKTASTELSLHNRFVDRNGEFLNLRITQALDAYRDDRPFLPLKVEALLRRPLWLRLETAYDVHEARVEVMNSDVGIALRDTASLSVGERYERADNTLFYTLGIQFAASRSLSTEGSFWYDAKSGGLKDVIAKLKYRQQCWGVTAVVTKRQNDYSFALLFDLLGLGTIKL